MILFFIIVMLSGAYLKKPMGESDNFLFYINGLKKEVLAGDWQEASDTLKDLKNAWKIVIRRIEFSVERNELNGITNSISRLKGAILAEDKAGALIELSLVQEKFSELGK